MTKNRGETILPLRRVRLAAAMLTATVVAGGLTACRDTDFPVGMPTGVPAPSNTPAPAGTGVLGTPSASASPSRTTVPATGPAKQRKGIILDWNFDSHGFEQVGRQFQDKRCSSAPSYVDGTMFSVVSSPARRGRAVRHQVRNCDERSELSLDSGFLKANQEYWIGWSLYVPPDANRPAPGKSPSYTIVQQVGGQQDWKAQQDGKLLIDCNTKLVRDGRQITKGPPGNDMTLYGTNGRYELTYKIRYYRGMDSQGRYLFGCKDGWKMPVTVGRWMDFVMHIVPSADRNKAVFQLWQNGRLIIDEKLTPIRPDSQDMGNWKIGAYTGDPGMGDRLLYTDELRVGDSRASYADVLPG